MAKIKLTINELKHQKEALNRYQRYLPTLMLKKQYLQIEINKANLTLAERVQEEEAILKEMDPWIAVLAEDAGIADLVRIQAVEKAHDNIAGVDVRVFKGVRFKDAPYDLYTTPLWIDRAVKEFKRVLILRAEILALQEILARLQEELKVTTQRVNLFERIMIPRTLENIRMIQVFLSDQQTAAVVRGKIAKSKLEREVGRPRV
jgi:V/A-type H+-transporting ATPase subunit D